VAQQREIACGGEKGTRGLEEGMAAAAAEDERDGGGLNPVAGKLAARPSK
jgi:hypothetical protein